MGKFPSKEIFILEEKVSICLNWKKNWFFEKGKKEISFWCEGEIKIYGTGN